MAHNHRDLIAWRKAMELAMEVSRLTQRHRAAVSIPGNVAEGQGRLNKGESNAFGQKAREVPGMLKRLILKLET